MKRYQFNISDEEREHRRRRAIEMNRKRSLEEKQELMRKAIKSRIKNAQEKESRIAKANRILQEHGLDTV